MLILVQTVLPLEPRSFGFLVFLIHSSSYISFIVFVRRSTTTDCVLNFISPKHNDVSDWNHRGAWWVTQEGETSDKGPDLSVTLPVNCFISFIIIWSSTPPEDHEPKSHVELSNSLFLSLLIRGLAHFTESTDLILKSMQLCPGPGDFFLPPSTVRSPGAERPTTIDI